MSDAVTVGYAFLAFAANLTGQQSVPNVLSLSLGSLRFDC